jgi:hypothetical protein
VVGVVYETERFRAVLGAGDTVELLHRRPEEPRSLAVVDVVAHTPVGEVSVHPSLRALVDELRDMAAELEGFADEVVCEREQWRVDASR